MSMPIYTSQHLSFRPLNQADQEALATYYTDPQISRYFDFGKVSPLIIQQWIARQLRRYEDTGGGLMGVELKTTKTLIGQAGLVRQFVDGIPKWEVVFHIFPAYFDSAYTAEAAVFFRNHCFQEEMAETLIAIIHPAHETAKELATAIGMSFWKNTLFKGAAKDIYRIRRSEWESHLKAD